MKSVCNSYPAPFSQSACTLIPCRCWSYSVPFFFGALNFQTGCYSKQNLKFRLYFRNFIFSSVIIIL